MSDLSIFIFGMLVFGVAIGSALISIIGTSQSETKIKERKQLGPGSGGRRVFGIAPLVKKP